MTADSSPSKCDLTEMEISIAVENSKNERNVKGCYNQVAPGALGAGTQSTHSESAQPRAADPGTQSKRLFQEQWWLDAASNGAVESVELRWDGLLVGSLAFLRKRRYGVCHLNMPPFTRSLGPVLMPPESSPVVRTQNIRRIVRELISLLPPHDRFHHVLDPNDETPLAFSLAGSLIVASFTFRTAWPLDLQTLHRDIEPRVRRLIRSGSRGITFERHLDIERFVRLSLVDRPAGQNEHDFPALRRIFAACEERHQTVILTAVDHAGADIAAVILIWDSETLYYWVPARDRARAGSGSGPAIIWEAMQFASSLGRTFDFDGYRSVETARLFSCFGVLPNQRPTIIRFSRLGRLLEAAWPRLLVPPEQEAAKHGENPPAKVRRQSLDQVIKTSG